MVVTGRLQGRIELTLNNTSAHIPIWTYLLSTTRVAQNEMLSFAKISLRLAILLRENWYVCILSSENQMT